MRRFAAVTILVVALSGCSGAAEPPAPTPVGSATAPEGEGTAAADAAAITSPGPAPATSEVAASAPTDPAQAAAITAAVRQVMDEFHLKSVLYRVSVDGREVVTGAMGDSMSAVPATTDMHFRNGAVAISFVANLVLLLAEEGVVSLDDKVSTWLPEIPFADQVTLGQLATMTSGYRDYVPDPQFQADLYANPFKVWTPDELIRIATAQPLWYEPGTNWNYAHTNYVILGLALEKATGRKMEDLLQDKVLGPLGLKNTRDPGSAWMPEPVQHAFTSERRDFLKLPPELPFYEESSFWNTSWSITRGAIQFTNIADMDRSAIAIGTGEFLAPESYQAMVSTRQREFGGPVEGCPSCRRGDEKYTYGIGIVIKGDWLLQNPFLFGYSSVAAYLPSEKIAISVANTYAEEAYNSTEPVLNRANDLFYAIADVMAPDHKPPH